MLFKHNFCTAIATATLMALAACGGGGSDATTTASTGTVTPVVTTVADKSPVVDTSQTNSYDATSVISAPAKGQPFYGQDAQFAGTQPSYTKSSDGLTVKDNITGLTWQQSPDTTGDGTIDSKDKLTWTQTRARPAVLNATNYGGYNDWRLPTIKELYSLINFMGTDVGPGSTAATLTPFIDSNYFGFGYVIQLQDTSPLGAPWAT